MNSERAYNRIMDKIVNTASIRDSECCKDFVVFDTETTGLYPWNDKIIEIGAARFRYGKPVARFDILVNPGIHIPQTITDLTHITDDMV